MYLFVKKGLDQINLHTREVQINHTFCATLGFVITFLFNIKVIKLALRLNLVHQTNEYIPFTHLGLFTAAAAAATAAALLGGRAWSFTGLLFSFVFLPRDLERDLLLQNKGQKIKMIVFQGI